MSKTTLAPNPGAALIETFFNSSEHRFYAPSRWLWGDGVVDRLMQVAAEFERPLLVVDSILASHPVPSALRQQVPIFREVQSSGFPSTQDATELAASLGAIDGIVAIGGGSTIDLAKAALAHFLFGELDGVGMGNRRGETPRKGIQRPPLLSVPTTCGSGAEASRYYVTYDRNTRAKVHGKTWQVVSDWIFSDPTFLHSAPAGLIVETAFDAFVHFWETYFCRHEASWLSRQLSLHGIDTILGALPAARQHVDDTARKAALTRLSYAATLGGVAISNVRTGNIHEAAGPLFEATDLSHGQTLLVFFAGAIHQYRSCILNDSNLTSLIDRAIGPTDSAASALIDWWEQRFAETGLLAEIAASLAHIDPAIVQPRIVSRVCSDLVWCQKESPIPLDTPAVRELVESSIARFRK